MCDSDDPDYAVVELRKKNKIKQNVKENRASAKVERSLKQ